jgi:outer membrane protein assembly factor BamB
MNCDVAHDRIELYVLGELTAEDAGEVRSHLAECNDCRAVEAETRSLLNELAAGRSAREASEELAAVVRAAGRAALAASRRRRWTAIAASVAAVLMIGLGVWAAWPAEEGASERWQYRGAQAAPTSMADDVLVQGSTLYLLHGQKIGAGVTAVDSVTGQTRWQSEAPSIGFLAADADRVYALTALRPGALNLVALSAKDGTPLWRYEQSGLNPRRDACRPVPLGGGAVCWTTGSTVHMIDAKTGERKWTRALAESCRVSRAAVKDGNLYAACRKKLHCLDAATGEPLWAKSLDIDAPGGRRPILALGDDRIYVGLPRGKGTTLLCLDAADRRRVWQKDLAKVQHLLSADGILYVRADGVVALDGRSGNPLWRYAAQGCGPMTRNEGLLHFADAREGGRLVAVNERTGEEAWLVAGLRSCNGFVRLGGTGYIKTLDGVVHAIALRRAGRP